MVREFYITPTYTCNSRCPMCGVFNTKKDSRWKYTLEQMKARIESFKLTKDDYIIISGGEPTIYPGLIEIIAYINQYTHNVTIFSNGRALKDLDYVKKFEKLHIEKFLIPLFSHHENIHNFLTMGKEKTRSFRDTIEGLDNLNKSKVPFRIKTVVFKQNYKHLPELAQFWIERYPNSIEYSIHGIHLQGEAPKAKDIIVVKHSEAMPYVEKAADIILENNLELELSAFPICLINPYYWPYYSVPNLVDTVLVSPDAKAISATSNNNYSQLPSKCRSCTANDKCVWAWQMYCQFYGEDELEPIEPIEEDHTCEVSL